MHYTSRALGTDGHAPKGKVTVHTRCLDRQQGTFPKHKADHVLAPTTVEIPVALANTCMQSRLAE